MILAVSLGTNVAVCLSSALPALVALVAVNAVVDIARHLIVLEIIRIISAMASGALEYGVVIGICVARRADSTRITVSDRERRVLRMVEYRAGPRCRVVARLAGRREKLRLRRMAGIRRVVVVGLMTADAGCGQSGVVVVDVAIGTLPRRNRVRSRQRERRVVVVKRRIGPYRRVMAQFASGRKTGRRMRRVRRARIVLLMARVAEGAVQ